MQRRRHVTVTYAIKVPRGQFESSRRTQPAQLLKSGCRRADDDTDVPRLAGFTAWQRSRVFRVYSNTFSSSKALKSVYYNSKHSFHVVVMLCVMFIKLKLIKKRRLHFIDSSLCWTLFLFKQTLYKAVHKVLNENICVLFGKYCIYFTSAVVKYANTTWAVTTGTKKCPTSRLRLQLLPACTRLLSPIGCIQPQPMSNTPYVFYTLPFLPLGKNVILSRKIILIGNET